MTPPIQVYICVHEKNFSRHHWVYHGVLIGDYLYSVFLAKDLGTFQRGAVEGEIIHCNSGSERIHYVTAGTA